MYDRLDAAGHSACAGQVNASPGYFQAMGIPILSGRAFENGDNDSPARGSVVVSQAFAERMWAGDNPIGKGVAPQGRTDGPFYNVVGVVGDIMGRGVDPETALAIYYPLVPQEGGGFFSTSDMAIAVSTDLDRPETLFPELRRTILDTAPGAAVTDLDPMASIVAHSRARVTFVGTILNLAGILGLVLAGAGLYGIIAYVVSKRTREIGTRLAIGAPPSAMSSMMIKRSLGVVAVGLLAGVLVTAASGQVLTATLYGVAPFDPVVMGGTVFILVAVSMAAAWFPARRASRIPPSVALKSEG